MGAPFRKWCQQCGKETLHNSVRGELRCVHCAPRSADDDLQERLAKCKTLAEKLALYARALRRKPGEQLPKAARGQNAKNIARSLRKPPRLKTRIPVKVGRLVEHTETDSQGRQITRFFGDPLACWGQFSGNPPELIEPHGAARDETIRQMHHAGLADQQIAEKFGINIKTVERALKGHRKRARTRKKR